MKVILEMEMDTLRSIDELLRVDKEAFYKAIEGNGTASDPPTRILKLRNIFGLSNSFDREGNSPAINGINP